MAIKKLKIFGQVKEIKKELKNAGNLDNWFMKNLDKADTLLLKKVWVRIGEELEKRGEL